MIVTTATKGNAKPDVFDVLLGDTDRRKTPLFDKLKKGPGAPTATQFQWPFELMDQPDTDGSTEGNRFSQDETEITALPGILLGRMHYYKKTFGVGELTEKDEIFGLSGDSLFAYLLRKAARKALISAEAVIIGNQESQIGSRTVRFKTRGLELLLNSTADIALQTDEPTRIPVDFRPSAAQIQKLETTGGKYTLTEDNLTAPMDATCKALGDKVDFDIHCTLDFKKQISKKARFVPTEAEQTVVRRFNEDAADKKITATIDTYEGDSGTARLHYHSMLKRDGTTQTMEAFGLDCRYAQLRVREAPAGKRLPDQNAGPEGTFRWCWGLQATPKFGAAWKTVNNVAD
jgi:Family of unknown function (DUF5309)